MSHLLKRLQIHRRLFMQISSSGPEFLLTSTISARYRRGPRVAADWPGLGAKFAR